ncbi:MAG TPA: FecR family protein [Solirubrobacteraceae bacterium]|nr:FecR family protein [Solirubrobacteraceae bacterium]
MRGRLLGILSILTVLVALAVGTPAAAAGGMAVKVTFAGNGQYVIDQTYQYSGGTCTTHDVWTLQWTSVFQTSVDDGALQGATGQLTSGSPGTASMTVGGICTYRNTVPSCSSALSAPSQAPALTASGSDPIRVEAQSIAGGIAPSCSDPTDGPFIGRDAYFFNNALPDAMSAIADIPSRQLIPGASFPVSSSGAPGHVISDCTGQGPSNANTACSASLTWDGTITISCAKAIGKVTFSEGDAPAVGTEICDGETVSTGNGRLEITYNDGSVMRVGPNSQVQVDESASYDRPITFHVILGAVWAKVSDVLGSQDTTVETGTDAAGVRGCQFTASAAPGGGLLMHVIQGRGFYTVAGHRTYFPTGYTLMRHGSVAKLTAAWPAVQQGLVAPAAMPPKLSAVKLSGANLGPRARLRLRLSQAASLTVQILRGKRTVASFTASGRAGSNTLRLRHRPLPKGPYTLIVTATHAKLVSLAQISLRLH